MALKTLTLVRHAKASSGDRHLADHDRPLTSRGRREAAGVGRYLREEGIRPDLVLCSSALRTTGTLELLDLPAESPVRVEAELYGATASMLLDRLRHVSDDARSVLLIGHNPGIRDAATSLLADRDVLTPGFPTATLVQVSLPIESWQELRPGIGRLDAFVVPTDDR